VKLSFGGKCVPKCSFGTRGRRNDTFERRDATDLIGKELWLERHGYIRDLATRVAHGVRARAGAGGGRENRLPVRGGIVTESTVL
jgi:hypothetical protein